MPLTDAAAHATEAHSRSNGNVPDPPQLQVKIMAPNHEGEQQWPNSHASVPTEPLFSSAGQRSPSTWPHDLPFTPTSYSPAYERRASQEMSANPFTQLQDTLDQLSHNYDVMVKEMNSTYAANTHGSTLSLPTLATAATQSTKNSQAQFLTTAKRLINLLNVPVLRSMAEQVLWPALPIATYEQGVPPSSPSLDPRLERYYEAAGNVQLEGEKLAELDHAYAEEVAERSFLQDQGRDSLLSEDDARETYLRQRHSIELELDGRIELADRYKTECIEAGLNLNAGVRVVGDMGSADDENVKETQEDAVDSQSDTAPRLEAVASFEGLPKLGKLTPASKSALDVRQPYKDVERWIADTFEPGEDPATLAPESSAYDPEVHSQSFTGPLALADQAEHDRYDDNPTWTPGLEPELQPLPTPGLQSGSPITGSNPVDDQRPGSPKKPKQPKWLTDEEKQSHIPQIHGWVEWESTTAASTITTPRGSNVGMPTLQNKRSDSALQSRTWSGTFLEALAWMKGERLDVQPP